jgi:hypothetical protein
MRNPVYVTKISNAIIKLHREYPGLPIGEHIAHALDGGDIYNISDKDLAESLTNYIASMDLDAAYQADDILPEYDTD